MFDQRVLVEPGLEHYYPNGKAFAEVVLTKGLLSQNITFAVAENGSGIVKKPVV